MSPEGLVQDVCDTLDRFGRERLDARAIDRAHRIPPGILEELAELGVFGLSIPERWGGLGLDLAGVCKAITTLARHDRAVATTVGLHAGLGTRGLVAFGTDAQREAWLPDAASGRRIAAFATTEPDAGSDIAAIRTRATPSPRGLKVEGTKIFVTNGGLAGMYTLTVATPGLGGARRGTGLVVVAREDGPAVGPEEDKLGLRGSSTTSLVLDLEVPEDRVIGGPGKGQQQLPHVLAWGRTAMAAGCIGTADVALRAAARHVTHRRQFGKPLAAMEVVRGQLARMATLKHGMEAIVAWTAASPDDATLAARSTSAKVFCSEAAWEIVDTALQLHGGSGYIEETGIPLLMRDARITRIFEGANDVLRVHLGLMNATATARPAEDPLHERLVERAQALRTAWGVRLASRQADLHALGELALQRDVGDAVAAAGEPVPADRMVEQLLEVA
jgi:alkylation response protein AidB-like acyl-CoA dehydrogenase